MASPEGPVSVGRDDHRDAGRVAAEVRCCELESGWRAIEDSAALAADL
jgi:hypothetical protein